ncbi:MAG: phosphate signaling complex protein PhoU [Actinobacteria bacterium]|nr:phosphate signaling complex protein PhoU [Actinomycetota bacterium]
MSPAGSADGASAPAEGNGNGPGQHHEATTDPVPLRLQYSAELEQLRLQTEVMGVRVDENLERTRQVLLTGSVPLAVQAIAADDDIDAMNVSLTERCYDILARESPKAGDLRLVVSVIRVIAELERVGDLSLRVAKLAPDHALLRSSERTFDILCVMADEAVELFRAALRAWGDEDLVLAIELASGPRSMDLYYEQLTEALLRLSGPDAVPIALRTLIAGRALERIADHASLIGTRVRYLVTGDPNHLAAEVR